MKRFTLYTKADFDKIEKELSSFLFYDTGFLEKKKIQCRYSGSVNSVTEVLISNVFDEANDGDLKLIENHVQHQIDYSEKDVVELTEKLNNAKKRVERFEILKSDISKRKTFQEVIKYLISK